MTIRLFIPAMVMLLSACAGPPVIPVEDLSTEQQRPATFHIVQSGDTLYSIAWAANKDYRNLADWNGISSPYVIRTGQKLALEPPQGWQPPARVSVTAAPESPKVQPSGSVGTTTTATPAATQTTRSSWVWPAEGPLLSRFQPAKGSKGIDIQGGDGAPVLATANGEVVYAGAGLRGYGNLVIIKHNETYLSAYAHGRRLLVKEGDNVTAGQTIAEMGSTGTDQVKLHFEIRRDGSPVDPLKFLPIRKS